MPILFWFICYLLKREAWCGTKQRFSMAWDSAQRSYMLPNSCTSSSCLECVPAPHHRRHSRNARHHHCRRRRREGRLRASFSNYADVLTYFAFAHSDGNIQGFDLVVAHPHRHLLHFATLLEQDLNSNSGGSGSGRREGVSATPWFVDRVGNRVESGGGAGSSSSAAQKSVTKLLRDAVNVAWQLLTDSYHTRLPLEASPPHLAVVALWVAVEAQGELRYLWGGGGLKIEDAKDMKRGYAPVQSSPKVLLSILR